MTVRPCSPRLLVVLALLSCLLGPFSRVAAQEEFADDEAQLELAALQDERLLQQPQLDTQTRDQPQGVSPPLPEPRSPVSGTFGFDLRNQYAVYGLVIQGQGLTTQPYLNLRYTAVQNADPKQSLNNLTLFLTTWSDFSSNTKLSSPSSPFRLYTESDLILGLSATLAQRFNANLTLTSFLSPAGAYGFGSFARGIFLYDDTNQLARHFALKPQFTLIYSIPSAANIGLAPGSFLFEPGLTPNITLNTQSRSPLNVALPLRLGLGNQFFAGSTYGYFSLGPQFSLRLPGLSSKTVNTNLNFGYTYTNLGPTTANFAANKSPSQHAFNLGITVNF